MLGGSEKAMRLVVELTPEELKKRDDKDMVADEGKAKAMEEFMDAVKHEDSYGAKIALENFLKICEAMK